MDPCRDPVFSEQDCLDLYTSLSDSAAEQSEQEQELETEQSAAGSELKRAVTHTDAWSITLIDSAQGSNSRTASLCVSTSQLLSKYRLNRDKVDSSVVWARVAPVHVSLLESAELLFNVSVPWLPVELPYRSRLNSTAQELMEAVLVTLDHSASVSGQYLMKLCDSEEYLRSDEILGLYERIQVYQKFALDVPVRMVLKDSADKTPTRHEEDDRQMFHFNQVLASACAFSTLRSGLQEKLCIYSQAVNKLLRSWCDGGVREVVESVHAVCEQLCGVTTADLEDDVGRIQCYAPVTLTPVEMCDCETAVVMLHHALLKLLHIFFTNFDLDFRGQEDHPNPPAADVKHSGCMLQVNLTCLYRLLPGWINRYDQMFNTSEKPGPQSIAMKESQGFEDEEMVNGLFHTGSSPQMDFPESEQWRYERAAARPEAVLESALCEELQKRVTEVCQKHSLLLMTDNEKAFLWSKRHICSQRNSRLHLVLGSAPQWRPQDLPEIYSVLERWSPVSAEEALFLLSDEFHDQRVRSVAVQCFQQMCDSELEEFLPQLVQALKMEWEIDGPLMKLLLSRSLHCIRIAQQLYWLLVDALDDWLYKSWMNKVLSALKHCCGRALRHELQRQSRLVDLLTQVAEKIRTADKNKRKDVFRRERWKIVSFFADGQSCRLPLDPAVVVKAVNIEVRSINAFGRFTVHERLVINAVSDVFRRERWKIVSFFADGQSCRLPLDPAVVVKAVNIESWCHEWLGSGLVEVVRDAVTLAKIHQEWGLSGALREDTLEKWFHMRNKTKEDYEKAVMNFLHSCAGWCVATFVLGICDRHNDNIMIKHSGHMFHIDFGKIMGNAQKFGSIKRDRTPFIFTPEMQRFITGGGENPQRFHRFVELSCDAYNSLRRRSALVLSLLQLMLAAGMPELKDVQDLQYVHNKLRPHDSELEATSYFTKKIKESMESFPVKLNFLIHNMVQFSSVKRSEAPAESQISSNTNIQEAVIQKYTANGKDVTYELKVAIEDGFLVVQKSFAQFEMLHKLLQKHFIESTLPKFPSWFNMSFTPGRKMSLLNKYLKELFEGPCKGNEYVCSLFLDGPNTAVKSETDAHLRPQIQLYLSYKDYKLSVMIKHLKNIRLSNGSCPDAYVVTRLRPDPQDKTKRKTKVVRSNDNPTFNELIEYRNVHNLHGHVLEVTVKSRKTFVAATNVVLGERVLDQEKWFPLGFSAV
ncbi:phosphatidylinositol 4-phosphate 3-kinase C2 domain-containing subunit gamma [Sinocyclocheilus grahami]|uniref:phosphatidylinositol 4-phosphate 3-kinase C2 domain-containing subunit gamma n=1 Tax=Sinocyclocheilus grahami TaxID=75366 RepID=UPI0007ACE58C|nr:PREDICTED: phosphatidylinositol 4-phosphate 3-kinase C2 domain-containing subunit gamma [Sinocyclocheilus grahami]